MKRFIYLIIVCSILCYAFITETEFSNKEIIQLQNLDEEHTDSFSIPNDDTITNPDNLYQALLDASARTHSNIIRTLFTDGENGYEVQKYVLLSGASDYMSAFEIKCGRMLTVDDSRSKNILYLSTRPSDSKMQIGEIRSEMRNMDLSIYSFYSQFSYYKADGTYMVELGDDVNLQSFLEILAESINKYCEAAIDASSLEAEEVSIVKLPYVDMFTLDLLQISFGILLLLSFLYHVFCETKKLSIIKLFGNENSILFWNYQKNFLYVTILSTLTSVLYCFSKYDNLAYLLRFLCRVSLFALIQFGVLSVILLIIMWRANILRGLKGGYSSQYIYCLNSIAKIICICVVIYSGQSVFDTWKNSALMEEEMKNWEIADDYGIFYPYSIGFDMSEKEEKEREITIARDLYAYLNDNGALFVDANEFEQEFQKLNREDFSNWQFHVSINPNYLKQFPLYDTDGNLIQVSEEESDLLLLVPEKYSSCEEEIISYWEDIQRDKIVTCRDYYGIEDSDLENQKVQIIWLQDNQGIFGFSTRVLADEEGYIEDAVVLVVTEKNVTILDRIGILGKGDLDPLKVFIGNDSDGYDTYNRLSPILDDLSLSDNLKSVVSVNENMKEQILELQSQRRIAMTMSIVGISLLTVLVIQSTVLDFHRNREKYMIKKIHGIHMLKIYGVHLLSSMVSYVVIGMALILLFRDDESLYYLSLTLMLIVIQYIISLISIVKLERNHIASVLKGA